MQLTYHVRTVIVAGNLGVRSLLEINTSKEVLRPSSKGIKRDFRFSYQRASHLTTEKCTFITIFRLYVLTKFNGHEQHR